MCWLKAEQSHRELCILLNKSRKSHCPTCCCQICKGNGMHRRKLVQHLPHQKTPSGVWKKQATEWQKVSVSFKAYKRLASSIYQDCTQINKKKTTQLKARDLNRHITQYYTPGPTMPQGLTYWTATLTSIRQDTGQAECSRQLAGVQRSSVSHFRKSTGQYELKTIIQTQRFHSQEQTQKTTGQVYQKAYARLLTSSKAQTHPDVKQLHIRQ